jgi:hypothetical protein
MVLALVLAATLTPLGAGAQDSQVPPPALFQQMLAAAKERGWVQFRNFHGAQLVYFTALQSLHCRLREIRYSINSPALDQRFKLVQCNPQAPFAMPAGFGEDAVLVRLRPGTARTVSVQVVWDDGTTSDVATYRPCDNAGSQTCALLVH